MGKRERNKKVNFEIRTANIITIILCIITASLLIVTCLNTYFTNRKYVENVKEMNEIMVRISSNTVETTEEELENLYLSYYKELDQKATDSINIALVFFGFIFSLVTIVNTIVSMTMPKQFEDKLDKIDKKVNEVEKNARESTIAVRYVSKMSSEKTTREKISDISEVIEEYGDNSGELYFARGFLYDDIKDYDSAKADYIRAKQAGGSKHVYYNSMGVVYSNIMLMNSGIEEKKQAFAKSEEHYKKAIEELEKLDKKSDYCHCNLACLYQDYANILKGLSVAMWDKEYLIDYQKYVKKALDEFDITISMTKDFKLAYLNRGISYREMGEEYYQNAYEDFQKCLELDPEDKKVSELLAKTSLELFRKTDLEEYYFVAKTATKKFCEEVDKAMLYRKRIEVLDHSKGIVKEDTIDRIIADIDEKIADLTIEEAGECSNDPIEYGNKISEALEHYRESIKQYKQLYSVSKNEEYRKAIERLQNKIQECENPKR